MGKKNIVRNGAHLDKHCMPIIGAGGDCGEVEELFYRECGSRISVISELFKFDILLMDRTAIHYLSGRHKGSTVGDSYYLVVDHVVQQWRMLRSPGSSS